MNAKEYLSQAFCIEMQVQSKLEQIEALRSLACRVTTSFDRAGGHSRNASSMQDTIVKIMEAEEELNRKIDELVTVIKEITDVIDRIPDVTLRLILENRYLLFHTWEEIAIDMNYARRWTQEKHREALDAVQRILDEREEEREREK